MQYLEAFRSGRTVDRLYVLDGCQDGPIKSILREAKKQDTIISFVSKERLGQLSETGNHQGVVAHMRQLMRVRRGGGHSEKGREKRAKIRS